MGRYDYFLRGYTRDDWRRQWRAYRISRGARTCGPKTPFLVDIAQSKGPRSRAIDSLALAAAYRSVDRATRDYRDSRALVESARLTRCATTDTPQRRLVWGFEIADRAIAAVAATQAVAK